MLTGKTYEEVYHNFRWDIPEYYNIGVDVADKWANEKYRLALIYIDSEGKEHKYTFWELKNLSNQLANALRAQEVGIKDRVGILLPPCPEALISHVAIYKLGAIAVPLLTLFGPDAIEFRLGNSEAKSVITDMENLPKILDMKYRLPSLECIVVSGSRGEEKAIDFWGAIDKGSRYFDPVRTKPEDPALIIYTSGTTGQPKGTLHGHQLLLGILPGFEFYHNLFPKEGDLLWTPLDWAYIGGSYDALFPTLHHGIPMLAYRARKFDPEEAFYYIAKYGVRNLMAVPTVLRMMRHAVGNPKEKFDFNLRSITVGGETLGEELSEWCRTQLGVQLNEQYGQTECDLVVGFCAEIMDIVPGLIGKAVPGHKVEVINEIGEVLRPDELGEIAVKRPDPVMFLEYWKNSKATESKFVADWMRTGDFGAKDKEGYFRFTGRQDDIIESGGFRIGPGEIEDCLMKHEAVALVGVIGVPDEIRGEIVKAFIVPKEGVQVGKALEESIQKYVKSRLEAHAYPREIEFLKDMPKTKSGKILRSELRKIHMAKKALGST
ncbi:MAG: AMP-dependent synthetase [Deltaproteobacteria bacterium RBG_13_49_15]|nr:MAG: AMP-dependent synthetase [Deltaproteobacteria bacterium RBG_13_49_15]